MNLLPIPPSRGNSSLPRSLNRISLFQPLSCLVFLWISPLDEEHDSPVVVSFLWRRKAFDFRRSLETGMRIVGRFGRSPVILEFLLDRFPTLRARPCDLRSLKCST